MRAVLFLVLVFGVGCGEELVCRCCDRDAGPPSRCGAGSDAASD